jgi:hypothetical protein
VKKNELFDLLISEVAKPFSGWDFSYITKTGRMVETPLTWNYASRILPFLRKARTLLDMGTGGGEFLSMLQPLPKKTYATESYQPNIPIARKKLESLGVKVIEIHNDKILPFDDNYFDLVINRHESYVASEVYRIIKSNCQFITQQVGGLNDLELNKMFCGNEDHEYKYWNLAFASKELVDAGFKTIEQKEEFPLTRFYDVGAIVYYLKAIPWQIPNFSVEKHCDALMKIHCNIQEHGYIDIKNHRFFIVAKK